ncbi:hypothetical protein TRFO_01803 [Tritrichomonas foetus]|uniref:Uncharacterized protein n=1 Tax=Tritrichomonas foetus TaxID=1144522 RepID=A0A1J4JI12_9EUKA|nr:hypothetical protein TRFO_01803 [Tritrichomonas foetus]|eukprot:OHS98766.1 hypothetical protein TRFO_01803 [Tritrichomonas foetus]
MSFKIISSGENNCFQLCHKENYVALAEDLINEIPQLTKISIGGNFGLAIDNQVFAYGWGDNRDGAIGLDEYRKYEKPTLISNLKNVSNVKCGNNFSLFLCNNGDVFIATPENEQSGIIQVASPEPFSAIFGQLYPYAVGVSGSVYVINESLNQATRCDNGQILQNINNMANNNNNINENNIRVKQILTIAGSNVILTNSGKTFGCGKVVNGSNQYEEIISLKGKNIIKIVGYDSHLIALSNIGEVFAWGFNKFGQLGLGNKINNYEDFVEIPKFSNSKIIDIGAGLNHTMFIDISGTIWGTGCGEFSKTMLGTNELHTFPQKSEIITNAISVICGRNFSFVRIKE